MGFRGLLLRKREGREEDKGEGKGRDERKGNGKEGKGSRGLLLRDGDGKGRERGNEGRDRRDEEEGGRRKGAEKPVLPIKNHSCAPVLSCTLLCLRVNIQINIVTCLTYPENSYETMLLRRLYQLRFLLSHC